MIIRKRIFWDNKDSLIDRGFENDERIMDIREYIKESMIRGDIERKMRKAKEDIHEGRDIEYIS